MLPIETETLVENRNKSRMIDQLDDNECLCSINNLNSEPMTSTEFTKAKESIPAQTVTIAKSYAVNNDIIQESYFDMDGMDNANEFINDYATWYPNGIILVVNKNGIADEASQILTSLLNVQLKKIIVCDEKPGNDIASASKTAFSAAVNGQAILFHGVSKNFDLFSHIY
jgi:hypothetical protein